MFRITTLLIFLPVLLFSQVPAYKNPKLDVHTRTTDLLSRMSYEEKRAQLLCLMGWEMYEKKERSVSLSQKFKDLMKVKPIGALWAVFRADPWTQKTLETGLDPEMAAEVANEVQRYAIENTRLGIPIFLAEESPHGHMAIGTTVFPTGIGQASTWNRDLVQKAWEVKAKEIRLQGAHIAYGPVLDISRDPRWSRVEESFGEDPVLTGELGAAAVRGAGGGNLQLPFSVISTLKHFAAYGSSEGGHNGNAVNIGPIDLHQNFLFPFEKAIKAGALSIMTSYNSIDGVPSTADEYLLNQVLRRDWGFKGFVVSDLFSIDGIYSAHRVVPNLSAAGKMALNAGVDMDLGGNAFDKLEGEQLDTAVYRILARKFEMGLFEHPFVDPKKAKTEVRSQRNKDVALDVARESVVLLKNEILPLGDKYKRIAVVGPNAHAIYNQLGDYTAPQDEGEMVTVYEGIKNLFPETDVKYAKGVAIRDTSRKGWEDAMELARNSEIIIAVVGGSSARDFKTVYENTGAAQTSGQNLMDMENGEGFDRANLGLLGLQEEFLKALKSTGKPLVVIYIQGRPLEMNWAAENADALLCAWYPGAYGGTALGEILKGKYNPSGRLPISVAKSVGQLPVYYNKRRPRGNDYVELDQEALYPFGYGKSYTKFEYSDLSVGTFEIKFRLKNIGSVDGYEIPQVYFSPQNTSVVQAEKQLKYFDKVFLKAGEEKWITFTVRNEDVEYLNRNLQKERYKDPVAIGVGSSSRDIVLRGSLRP